MCDMREVSGPLTTTERADIVAARRLARLVESDLGMAEGGVDPVALRLFILAKWDRITALAHKIHERRYEPFEPYQPTK